MTDTTDTAAPQDDPLIRRGFLDIPAASEALGVSKSAVYHLIKSGKLTAIQHSGLRVERSEIDDYFARLRAEGAKRRVENAKRTRPPSNRGPRPVSIAG